MAAIMSGITNHPKAGTMQGSVLRNTVWCDLYEVASDIMDTSEVSCSVGGGERW